MTCAKLRPYWNIIIQKRANIIFTRFQFQAHKTFVNWISVLCTIPPRLISQATALNTSRLAKFLSNGNPFSSIRPLCHWEPHHLIPLSTNVMSAMFDMKQYNYVTFKQHILKILQYENRKWPNRQWFMSHVIKSSTKRWIHTGLAFTVSAVTRCMKFMS